MRAPEPAQAARALIFGRTKMCGLNSGAPLCAARPAAFAGLVFVAGSPRHVTAQQAASLAETVRGFGVLPVGVFRDEPVETVVDFAISTDLHAVQLHGHEDRDYVATLRRRLPDAVEIWTAVSVGRDPLGSRGGDRMLFDNADGGSGRSFDWGLLEGNAELPRGLIAGGIGPHNAREAAAVGAYAIDVGSGVDEEPGVKSAEKIATLFEALRPAARERAFACA
jgi:indole-3-glycerol phosphate synthase / phosphoribosylanthranilate isomerase